nr:tryptophan synthase subunit alpha [Lebetimonas sp. JH369]
MRYIKNITSTPLFIGFGVNEKTAKEKAKGVDGVIVGSAFIKILLDDSLKNSEKIENISKTAKNIKEIINS